MWIPNWPIQRQQVAHPQLRETPFFIFGRPGRQKRQVLFCNRLALQQGIRVGTPLVEIPRSFQGEVQEHCPQEDQEALLELIPNCHQFSPLVGIQTSDKSRENFDSLFLDVSRTSAVLGGLLQVLSSIRRHFSQQGYETQVRYGQTIGQAWSLAHAPPLSHTQSADLSSPNTTLPIDDTQQEPTAEDIGAALEELPIACLPAEPETCLLLAELGVETLGQLLMLPRASLPSRFGNHLNRRIAQLLGQADERILVHHPEQSLKWRHRLEYPSGDWDVLQTIVYLLLQQAVNTLAPRQQGILSLVCRFRAGSQIIQLPLQLVEPTRDLDYLLQLLGIQIDRQQLNEMQELVELHILVVGDQRPQQQWLFEDQKDTKRQQRAALIERLSARLGPESVQQLRHQSQALPERNFVPRKKMTLAKPLPTEGKGKRKRKSAPSNAPATPTSPSAASLERPTRLYSRPKRMKWDGQKFYLPQRSLESPNSPPTTSPWVPLTFQLAGSTLHVVYAVGPERIESQWWEGKWVRRDYFRIQTQTGQRFWIFRQASSQQWYLHGDFA